jgi:hypothetical protein
MQQTLAAMPGIKAAVQQQLAAVGQGIAALPPAIK